MKRKTRARASAPSAAEASSVDRREAILLDFIEQQVGIEPAVAAQILTANVDIFGLETLLEAYAITTSARRNGNAWAYLLRVARGIKQEREEKRDERERQRKEAAANAPPAPIPLTPRTKFRRAMERTWPDGGITGKPWPYDELGPLPGEPGCRLSVEDQQALWRHMLERARRDIPRWQDMAPIRLGYAVANRLRMWWDWNPVTGPCPIPQDLLAEFHVPLTAADMRMAESVVLAVQAKERQRQDRQAGERRAAYDGAQAPVAPA